MQIVFQANDKEIFPQTIGIYRIYFLDSLNNKSYIGVASKLESKNSPGGFKHRWSNHLSDFRKGKNPVKLQNAYDFYGENRLRFEIIETIEYGDPQDLEQDYIDRFNSFNYGYNSRPSSKTQLGFNHSEESKLKMSKTKAEKLLVYKDRVVSLYSEGNPFPVIAEKLDIARSTVAKIIKQSGEPIKKKSDYVKIPIFQYSVTTGELIKKWGSAYNCAKEIGISDVSIRRVLKGSRNKTKNFYFSYQHLSQTECLNIITSNETKSTAKRAESQKERASLRSSRKSKLRSESHNTDDF